jgi:hypothetical protein
VVKPEDPNLSNKDYKVGPEKIDFNRPTREFIATIPLDHSNKTMGRKHIDFYTRHNPDSIPYKK